MSRIIKDTSAELKRRAASCREEADSLRDEAASLDREADELDERAEAIGSETVDETGYSSAIAQLLQSPELAEWEKLRLESRLVAGELKASEVVSRFLALGNGVPAVAFDMVHVEKRMAAIGARK